MRKARIPTISPRYVVDGRLVHGEARPIFDFGIDRIQECDPNPNARSRLFTVLRSREMPPKDRKKLVDKIFPLRLFKTK